MNVVVCKRFYQHVLRNCICSASRVYMYCISWPIAVVKQKRKFDAIEDELIALGNFFDFLVDKDGEKRKRINSLQRQK